MSPRANPSLARWLLSQEGALGKEKLTFACLLELQPSLFYNI